MPLYFGIRHYADERHFRYARLRYEKTARQDVYGRRAGERTTVIRRTDEILLQKNREIQHVKVTNSEYAGTMSCYGHYSKMFYCCFITPLTPDTLTAAATLRFSYAASTIRRHCLS